MSIKLTKVDKNDDVKSVVEQFNTQFDKLIDESNKELDKVNKYLVALYKEEVSKDNKTKTLLDKMMKTIQKGLDILKKNIKSSKDKDYEIYTFEENGILGLLLVSKSGTVIPKTIDHSTYRVNSAGISAIYNNDTRLPLRVELNGNGYPILLTTKDVKDKLIKGSELDEVLKFELGMVKEALTNPNTFKGFNKLTDIAGVYNTKAIAICKYMKCTNMEKEIKESFKNNLSSIQIENIMKGINLIGINSEAEAKLLGTVIKKETDKDIKIGVLKKLFAIA